MIKTIFASLFAAYSLTSGQGVEVPAPGQGAGAGSPPGWVPVPIPTGGAAQSTVLECVLAHTDPAGCAGRATTITNAATNFKMECSNIGACAAAQISFIYENSNAERVEQLCFSEQYAGYGATVIMDSTNSAIKQYIDKFECKAYGACENVNVKLFGGSSINDVDCGRPEYCSNCNIHECEWGAADAEGNRVELCGTPKACFFH
eukprot:UN00647